MILAEKEKYLHAKFADLEVAESALVAKIDGYISQGKLGSDVFIAIKNSDDFKDALKKFAADLEQRVSRFKNLSEDELIQKINAGKFSIQEMQSIARNAEEFSVLMSTYQDLSGIFEDLLRVATGHDTQGIKDNIVSQEWLLKIAEFAKTSTIVSKEVKDVLSTLKNNQEQTTPTLEQIVAASQDEESKKFISTTELKIRYNIIYAQFESVKALLVSLKEKNSSLSGQEFSAEQKAAIDQFLSDIKSGATTISKPKNFPQELTDEFGAILRLRNDLNDGATKVIQQCLAARHEEQSPVGWLRGGEAATFFTGEAQAYFTDPVRKLVNDEISTKPSTEPTIENIVTQMKAKHFLAAQTAINSFLALDEGKKFEERLAATLGEAAANEFIEQFLKNYSAIAKNIINLNDIERISHDLAKIDAFAKFFHHENDSDILDILNGLNVSINDTLSLKPELKSLSDYYKPYTKTELQEVWKSISVEEHGFARVKDYMLSKNKEVTVSQEEKGYIRVLLKTNGAANMLSSVNIIKALLERTGNNVVQVNLKDVAAAREMMRLLKEAGLDPVLGEKAREAFTKSGDSHAQAFMQECDNALANELRELQEKIHKSEVFPDLMISEDEINTALRNVIKLVNNEDGDTPESILRREKYKALADELKISMQELKLLKEIEKSLLTEKDAMIQRIDIFAQKSDLTNDVFNLKNEARLLDARLDNARHNLAKKWKAISADIKYITHLNYQLDIKTNNLGQETSSAENSLAPSSTKPLLNSLNDVSSQYEDLRNSGSTENTGNTLTHAHDKSRQQTATPPEIPPILSENPDNNSSFRAKP